MEKLSRRDCLSFVGGACGASALAGCQKSPEATPAGAAEPGAASSEEAWAYRRLDPTVAGQRVYSIYPGGGCMYALFGGILLCLSDKCGGALSSFPLHMMKYGAGGVGGWGTLCGALNGAAAAIGLFVTEKRRREDLIAELFSWYENESLPKYRPVDGSGSAQIVATTSKSVLCHVSVQTWCHASGGKIESKERTERCRRLTVDVAMKTVDLLNGSLQAAKPTPVSGPAGQASSESRAEKPPEQVMGKMRCDTCHLPAEKSEKTGKWSGK